MPQNETYGYVSEDELQAMKENARPCIRCGMTANVDPIMHESRYGHAPAMYDENGQLLIWKTNPGDVEGNRT